MKLTGVTDSLINNLKSDSPRKDIEYVAQQRANQVQDWSCSDQNTCQQRTCRIANDVAPVDASPDIRRQVADRLRIRKVVGEGFDELKSQYQTQYRFYGQASDSCVDSRASHVF